ncbi:MAG: hypothetical protein K0U47_12590 [Epsilonproteobacteria bacterium]|nr:hypothetical protein [Campylobacterota bacterium]
MQKVNETIDIARKDEYLAQVEDYKKKYKDKKSELEWADDEWEESVIEDEMNKYAARIKLLNQQIAAIQQVESRA